MQIPKPAALALDLLQSAGFEAFVVGGCVRDSLLSKEPFDWDITTSAFPEETKKVFEDFKVIETGIKHGTVTVIIDDTMLEVTTYRVDGEYKDNRHPENVTFTRNLKEDLARRDFTINALALKNDGSIVDEFGGIEDLNADVIRCVGDPDKRFNEDALRIMRALRFSSTLGFEIEEDTSKSIHKNANLLNNIAYERICDELLKLLCGDKVTDILIEYRDVFGVIIPELIPCFDFDHQNIHHVYDVYDHTAHSVGSAEPLADVRLALLLHDIGKPSSFFLDETGTGRTYGHAEKSFELAKPILERLRLSNDMKDLVLNLVLYHDYLIKPDEKEVLRALYKFGPELLDKIMLLKIGDNAAHNMETGDFEPEIRETQAIIEKAKNGCYTLKCLDINGNDIKELGVEGQRVGEVLEQLLFDVIDEKIENKKEKLIERVKELGTSKA